MVRPGPSEAVLWTVDPDLLFSLSFHSATRESFLFCTARLLFLTPTVKPYAYYSLSLMVKISYQQWSLIAVDSTKTC